MARSTCTSGYFVIPPISDSFDVTAMCGRRTDATTSDDRARTSIFVGCCCYHHHILRLSPSTCLIIDCCVLLLYWIIINSIHNIIAYVVSWSNRSAVLAFGGCQRSNGRSTGQPNCADFARQTQANLSSARRHGRLRCNCQC